MSPKEKVAAASGNDEFTVDMTTAKVLEPIPTDRWYLFEISKWELGHAKSSGAPNVAMELTVVEPSEFEGRKVTDSPVLNEPFNLGRVKTYIVNSGFQTEEQVKVAGYKIPKEDVMLGLQFAARVNISKNETYGDRNRITVMRPAAKYAELAAAI